MSEREVTVRFTKKQAHFVKLAMYDYETVSDSAGVRRDARNVVKRIDEALALGSARRASPRRAAPDAQSDERASGSRKGREEAGEEGGDRNG